MGEESNATCVFYGRSPEQDKFIENFAWCMENYVNLSVGVIGVVLNSITIIVLSTSTMKNLFFNRLLICLAVFDNLYLFCEISEVFRLQYYTFIQQQMFVIFVYPVRSVVLCSSIYMTVSLTLERHQAITCPLEYLASRATDVNVRLLHYVMPVLVFSVIYYIPKFYDLKVEDITVCAKDTTTKTLMDRLDINHTHVYHENCTTQYHIIPSILRMDHYYVLWYLNISNLVFTAIIPFSILMYLNFKIYSSLNQFRQRQPSTNPTHATNTTGRPKNNDVKKTFILFCIVVVFVACHSLRIVLNIDEFINLTTFKEEQEKGCVGAKFWTQIAFSLSQLLLLLNSSANFFIYVFFDQEFQRNLRQACLFLRELHSPRIRNGNTDMVRQRQNLNANDIELSVRNLSNI